MKIFFSVLLLNLVSITIYCQINIPQTFSLEKYTPSITVQDGANCYAYAGAYVMLSTQTNYLINTSSDSTNSYSFGFVDGAVNYFLKKIGRKKFNKLVNDSLYNSIPGIIGNLDYVFFVLKYYGTVKFKDFPYTKAKAINSNFDKASLGREDLVKIKSINEIFECNQVYNDSLIKEFKKNLLEGKPIVCSIHQNEPDCEWANINSYSTTEECMGNHIVTIVGFDNTNFIVKNNYSKVCIGQYPILQFFKILKWAYTYNL